MPEVCSASPDDAGALRPMLGRAFVEDPLITWALPHASRRLEHAEAWLGWFLDAYLRHGRVHRIGQVAAALWLPPGQRAAASARSAPTLHELLAELTGREHATRVLTSFATTGAHRPAEGHIYLHILGVDPAHQGAGHGAAVMAPVLDASEDDGVAVHLESANPRNHPFYERLGFERIGVAHLAEGGPTLTMFRRSPSADRAIA